LAGAAGMLFRIFFDGHVGLEIECVDRLDLNAYVPNLQVSGQVALFTRHRGDRAGTCPVGPGCARSHGRCRSPVSG